MSTQHTDALDAAVAAEDRALALYKDLLGGDAPDHEGSSITAFPGSGKVSWAAVVGHHRLMLQHAEECLALGLAECPKNTDHLKILFRPVIADLKRTLAAMEALPPWTPPPDGGRRRAA